MTKMNVLGGISGELERLPNLEQYHFFNFLKISPSYQLAREINKGSLKISKSKFPKDFKNVLKTYDLVGDVFEQTFEDWWIARGSSIFEFQEKRKFLVELDLDLPIQANTKNVVKILENLYQKKSANKNLISFQKNKIRPESLDVRYNLVWMKAHKETHTGSIKMYQFFEEANIPTKYFDILNHMQGRRISLSSQARTYVSNLISRNIKEAYYISENAARMKFPSKDAINSGLAFDYNYIESYMGYGRYVAPKYFDNPKYVEIQKHISRLENKRSSVRFKKYKERSKKALVDKFYEYRRDELKTLYPGKTLEEISAIQTEQFMRSIGAPVKPNYRTISIEKWNAMTNEQQSQYINKINQDILNKLAVKKRSKKLSKLSS